MQFMILLSVEMCAKRRNYTQQRVVANDSSDSSEGPTEWFKQSEALISDHRPYAGVTTSLT